jgi:hypothetical protein
MGKTFGKPTEDEESATNFMCVWVVGCGLWIAGIKEVEKAVSVFFDSKLIGWPGGKRDILFEVLYLEPVFKIDGYKN